MTNSDPAGDTIRDRPVDAERVAAATARLGAPALASLREVLVRRFGASDRAVRRVTVALDDDGRTALAGLLGTATLPPPNATVRCDQLAAALGVDEAGLRDVVATLAGGLGNRAAESAAARAALDEAASRCGLAAAPLGEPAVAWAKAKVRTLPGPLDARVALIELVCSALTAQLPGSRRPLAVVAAELSGDPHRLDLDRPAGSILADGAAAAAGLPAPTGAAARRAAVASFGIVVDELSSTVTTWALRPQPGHPCAAAASTLTDAGEPAVWTLSTVTNHPVTQWPSRVLVVENPAVVAVAAEARFDGTVICASGRPTVAVSTLVAQAVAAGATVDVHADFDPGGFGVCADLLAVGAQPWRMGAADYQAHLRLSTVTSTQPVPSTPWDPQMATVFAEHRRVVFEEQILDHVLT